jgi:hypothetical protein
MKAKSSSAPLFSVFSVSVLALFLGCGTTKQKVDSTTDSMATRIPSKYIATDERIIEIGKSILVDGGWKFTKSHLKECWVATNINFHPYDTFYIAPTAATVKPDPKEGELFYLAKENLAIELNYSFNASRIFTNTTIRESDLTLKRHVLKMENTIIEYAGGLNSWWNRKITLRVIGKVTDGDQILFSYEMERRGVPVDTLILGGSLRSEDIQLEYVRKMARDLTDFTAAVFGKYRPKE